MQNLSFNISTSNGTGSLSANQLLTRMLFRSGWELGAYNFFPSNIAGLPCLYNLRINSKSHIGFDPSVDVLVALNPKAFKDHIKDLKKGGLLISDESLEDFQGLHWKIPITKTVRRLEGVSPKQRTLFKNMVYVAFLCECLKVEKKIIQQSVEDFFGKKTKDSIVHQNLQIFDWVAEWSSSYFFPFSLPLKSLNVKKAGGSPKNRRQKEILIDGNTSSALGALFGACQFVSWYPITPATSLVENFEKLAELYQKDTEAKSKAIVLQAEDELASMSQVIGAGWAGLRAMTATSGPGLSLMAEGAGLSYFSETPAVICHVQRAGPSTGLPTRTQQSDLLSACFLSHGDSRHIVLMPGNPEEAFQFTALSFDVAEELQTLVIVLSDLDLGMNLKISPRFVFQDQKLKRGKVLKEEDLLKREFFPYKDEEGDGVSYRSLPGVRQSQGAYLTRGSGHNFKAEYSEKPEDYKYKLEKLGRKWKTAKKYMPASFIEEQEGADLAFITFGPNESSIQELRDFLLEKKIFSNYLRIRSFPFPNDLKPFLKAQSQIFVVEQNRDAQLKQLLSGEFPDQSHKMKSLLQYDGRPLMFSRLKEKLRDFLPLD